MQDPAFSAPGQFWRGNLHTHSNRSDGVLEPAEVCRRYKAEGYDFIALSDHFIGAYDYPIVDTRPFREEAFTTILGAELHSGAMENGELWHILAVGLPDDFAPSNSPYFVPVDDQETGPALARRARDAGAFVAVAHPEWGGLSLADARSLEAAHAVEVYNHGCQVGADRAEGFWHLDRLLEEGKRLNLCATDDAHFSEPDHFGGWTMVKAEENTPAALLAALRAGHMYASTGPMIHDVEWSGKTVRVKCSAATTIIAQGKGSRATAYHGASMTDVVVPLERVAESDWMRLTVIDAAGRRAWTNPVWKDN
ncbi:MAG: CehA/McbA family metallohydrolase [Pseudomonadota bacterium]